MSVSGVSFSNYYASNNQNVQSKSSQIQQEFRQLGQQISSGNSSAAQSDSGNIQNDVQSSTQHAHFHHHYHVGSGDSGSAGIEQLFQQLGQSVQPGDATAAQQSFANLQQDLQTNLASSLSINA
jgi:hypothetical protein